MILLSSEPDRRPRHACGLERRPYGGEGACSHCGVRRLATLAYYRRLGDEHWVLACSSRCFMLYEVRS